MNNGREIGGVVHQLHHVASVGKTILGKLNTRWGLLILLAAVFAYPLLRPRNENSYRPVQNAAPFVWPKGCSKAAFDQAIALAEKPLSEGGTGRPVVPCACFAPQNEIKDWYARGLKSYGRSPDTKLYYRIGNAAVALQRQNKFLPNSRCVYRNSTSDMDGQFFTVQGSGEVSK
jgi:hypothetical protein